MVTVMARSEATKQFRAPPFRDGPKDQTSDVQLHIGESRDSGFDAEPVIGPRFARTRWHRPGMTSENHTRPCSASPISSSTLGSSMVAGIVHGSPSAIFLMVPRKIFPERVFGSRAT